MLRLVDCVQVKEMSVEDLAIHERVIDYTLHKNQGLGYTELPLHFHDLSFLGSSGGSSN